MGLVSELDRPGSRRRDGQGVKVVCDLRTLVTGTRDWCQWLVHGAGVCPLRDLQCIQTLETCISTNQKRFSQRGGRTKRGSRDTRLRRPLPDESHPRGDVISDPLSRSWTEVYLFSLPLCGGGTDPLVFN